MKNMKQTAIVGLALLTAGLGFWLMAPAPAAAGPCGGSSSSFSESRVDMSGTAPCTLGGYSRKGSTMTLAVPVDKGTGSVRMICDGGASHVATGGWVQDTTSAGECIYKLCYETGPSRPPVTVCEDVRGGAMSVSSTPVELCPSGASESSPRKGFCVFDTAPSPEITGVTGDDMVKIKAGAKAYFESTKLSGPERLKWVQWISSDMSRDLMMPAGPPPASPSDPNAYKDLQDFMDSPPAGVVAVEPACYAVSFEACTTPPEPPPVDGVCGASLGGYFRTAPTTNLCYIGNGSAVASTETGWSWTCSGVRGGHASGACTALKPIDGVCGAADGKEFYNVADVKAGGLCSKGSASAVAGTGPWTWTCNGVGTGAVSKSCQAKTMTCEKYFNSMILVQDLTGSFGDDLPYMRSQMQALVNDPDFQTRKLGLARFLDVYDSYTYQKDMNLVEIASNKTQLTNTINTWMAGGGGDGPEAQWIAIQNVINDYTPQSDTPLTIILSTDATAHRDTAPYPTSVALATLLKSKDARLVVLVSNNGSPDDPVLPETFYRDFLSTNGVKGAVVPIASDSSNFLTALKTGLTEVCGAH